MVANDMMSKDLRDVIEEGIAAGADTNGFLMRYTFLDQSLLHQDDELIGQFIDLVADTDFWFELRAMNDGLVAIPQADFVWEGGIETFTDALFPMREKIAETIGEKAHLSHIVFLPAEFSMEGGEEE